MERLQKKLILTLIFQSSELADHIAQSLKPEIQKDIAQVCINLTQKKESLILEFTSFQTNVLQAAINSYVRWIETAFSVHSI